MKTKSVPAIERAFRILEDVAEHSSGVALPDLVRRLKLPRSTVHCQLLTLQRLGYLYRDEQTGRYMFGQEFFTLANNALSDLGLRKIAGPYLYSLMRRTGMTVHMGVLDGNEAVLIETIDSPTSSRIGTWVGRRMPVHCTAIGKALIASSGPDKIEGVISRGLTRYNENTIRSPDRLKAELARIRSMGYSFDDEEEAIGFRCVGVPIVANYSGVVAAISVAGRKRHISDEHVPRLADEVRMAAGSIGARLRLPEATVPITSSQSE